MNHYQNNIQFNRYLYFREINNIFNLIDHFSRQHQDYFVLDYYARSILKTYFSKSIQYDELNILIKISNLMRYILNYKQMKIVDDKIEKLKVYKQIEGFKDSQLIPLLDKEKVYELKKMGITYNSKYGRNLEREYTRLILLFKNLNLIKYSNILDIGCGYSFIESICKNTGQNCVSLDLPISDKENIDTGCRLHVASDNDEQPFFMKKIYKILENNIFEKTIKKNEFLNLNLSTKFDAVVCTQICFNRHNKSDLWNLNEWKFFLYDISKNYLKNSGTLFLNFNLELQNNRSNYFLGYKELDEFFLKFSKTREKENSFFNIQISREELLTII